MRVVFGEYQSPVPTDEIEERPDSFAVLERRVGEIDGGA